MRKPLKKIILLALCFFLSVVSCVPADASESSVIRVVEAQLYKIQYGKLLAEMGNTAGLRDLQEDECYSPVIILQNDGDVSVTFVLKLDIDGYDYIYDGMALAPGQSGSYYLSDDQAKTEMTAGTHVCQWYVNNFLVSEKRFLITDIQPSPTPAPQTGSETGPSIVAVEAQLYRIRYGELLAATGNTAGLRDLQGDECYSPVIKLLNGGSVSSTFTLKLVLDGNEYFYDGVTLAPGQSEPYYLSDDQAKAEMTAGTHDCRWYVNDFLISEKHFMIVDDRPTPVPTPVPTPADISGTHGTAKRLNGKTAIVSVFASDSFVKWDFRRDEDYLLYSNAHRYLGTAVEWIMDQAAQYGVNCEMIWDWFSCPSLYQEHTFTDNMVSYDSYSTCSSYIISEIPTSDILQETGADNILYVFFFNTPKDNSLGSCAWPFVQLTDSQTGYEAVYLFIGEFNQETTPGTYAHEILHLFGVPDIYRENERYYMSEAFINTYKSNYPRDIMAGAMSYVYDYVEFTFSPLVAYYAGLTRSCDLAEQWGLRKSDYDLYGY